jgi:hypothetical protein
MTAALALLYECEAIEFTGLANQSGIKVTEAYIFYAVIAYSRNRFTEEFFPCRNWNPQTVESLIPTVCFNFCNILMVLLIFKAASYIVLSAAYL